MMMWRVSGVQSEFTCLMEQSLPSYRLVVLQNGRGVADELFEGSTRCREHPQTLLRQLLESGFKRADKRALIDIVNGAVRLEE